MTTKIFRLQAWSHQEADVALGVGQAPGRLSRNLHNFQIGTSWIEPSGQLVSQGAYLKHVLKKATI